MHKNDTVYRVYWSEVQGDTLISRADDFPAGQISAAIKHTEALRKVQREDGTIRFITMVSEDPNSVGHPGAAWAGPDYDWKKRRP